MSFLRVGKRQVLSSLSKHWSDPRVEAERAAVNSRQRGFTLIELLISMTVLALLAVMLFSVLDATSKLWRDNEAHVDSFREARAGLNLMAREISQAFADPAGKLPVVVVNPTQAQVNQPPSIETDKDWGHRLFLLSTLSTEAQAGGENRSDLCAVGYYLAFTRDLTAFSPDSQGAGRSSYKLYRHFRSSNPTFESLVPPFSPTMVFRPLVGGASGDEILARNVTRMEIRLFERFRDSASNAFIGIREFDLTAGSWPVTQRPAVIEIALTAVNEDTAAKLETQSEWMNHSSPLQVRESQRFVTRIEFPE